MYRQEKIFCSCYETAEKQANVRNSMWRVGCHELAWENL